MAFITIGNYELICLSCSINCLSGFKISKELKKTRPKHYDITSGNISLNYIFVRGWVYDNQIYLETGFLQAEEKI